MTRRINGGFGVWRPWNRKLTYGAILMIRERYAYGQTLGLSNYRNPYSKTRLAKEFGVSASTLGKIISGFSYRHVA
jgi:hypothetical protein